MPNLLSITGFLEEMWLPGLKTWHTNIHTKTKLKQIFYLTLRTKILPCTVTNELLY